MKRGYSFTVALIIVLLVAIMIALIFRKMVQQKVKAASINKNVQAFLAMIRVCEGTGGPDGYRTVFGYEKVLQDLSDHPAITGEWKGKRLSDQMCRNAGLGPGCKSTAAGAYQFIQPTWITMKIMLDLPDFSPESQDLAAIGMLRQVGALDLIVKGDFTAAVNKASGTWASLPGNMAKQPQKSLAQVTAFYKNAGGTIA